MSDTKLPVFNADGQSAYIDIRTESSNNEGRQVIVVGDPAINNNVAAVARQDVGGDDQTTPGLVMRLAGSAQVKIVGSTGSLAVYFDRGNPSVTSYGLDGATARPLRLNSDGALKVYDLANGTVTANPGTGTFQVYLPDTGHELGSIKQINSSVAVYFDRAKPIVLSDAQHTASIFTVSGSTSGGTTSGVTLISPSANYNFKIFAYSIQTTGVASSAWRFTNGANSETEFWRPLVTAVETSSTPKGAVFGVQPPAFLFATGTSTTLALKSDTGSLVHYSVSYIKESA